MAAVINLLCIVDGESTAFPVDILPGKSICILKRRIKDEKHPEFADISSRRLVLWHVSLPEDGNQVNLDDIHMKREISKETRHVSDIFGAKAPGGGTIHIIVKRPQDKVLL
ncbi:hypothetical protein BCR41DRAFT_394840 [Lobosporangium transversale]|uniref:Crinkler effector protein N-terminal domain-containing protein n=1 Tax=Lobosporangium transversale TaxID=64571 RepID=A0A1Y2GS12_9FUNG|nr:hypothetical protein BCR41DRAFT_394840 [Lobosporangium transversale]ORZ20930.1 hypothetical protein BCR41DRAFT_394840 [Lobosporangium transversale]|eukprot:XP_021882839.1 hypothetical protein BCR41DRAFT_394840 [Lobosporangium transversale]